MSSHGTVSDRSRSCTQSTSRSGIGSAVVAALTVLVLAGAPPWSPVAGLDPKFDPSTRMRLVLVPTDATVGSVIYRLRATDEEFEYPLQFELVGDASSSKVQIETLPCTKFNSICQANVILTRRLEAGRYYDFQVSVKDTKGGMSVQSCSITATNFTTPHDTIFPHKAGIIMVPEDAKKGTELDYVLANKNPLLPKPVYLELWGSPLFGIRQKIISPDMTEGTIFLLGPLDFEKQAMYHLTVLANDAYAEPGQDTRNIAGLEVVIIVEDVQDVPPVFTVAPPVTRLPAGLIPGDKVLQVHAEDGDKGVPREIRYGLVSEGNPFTSFFDINETSGEITLLRPLDDILALTHAGDPVLLTVIAEEVKVTRQEPPTMATTVQLAFFLPERSNSPPYFENDHYVARLEENAAPGTVLTFSEPYTPRVMDDDAGKNGVFSLTLLDNNGTFEIAPNVAEGHANFVIRVRDSGRLDYEVATYVHFRILAQELGPATNLSTLVNVTVYLADANDNAPVFEQPDYLVDLPENMTAGTRVVQVHATDVDTAGLGGTVRYTRLLGPHNTSLTLDPASGVVTVATNQHGFDREAMPEYHLRVEARDDDGIGNRAEVPLTIRLIDVNDESPAFERSLYEFLLAADLANFTVPAFIRATDADAEAPNNEVRYELIYGNYENKFFLHPITGELRLTGPLRARDSTGQSRRRRQLSGGPTRPTRGPQPKGVTDVFVLTARAFDLGVPVRYSATTIHVYPPESRTRTVTFIVPGRDPDRRKILDTLQDITGGRVIIQEVRPYTPGDADGIATDMFHSDPAGGGTGDRFRSVVIATILYDAESVVDIGRIQQRLSANGTVPGTIVSQDERTAILYKAENRVLFWLLIFLAILLALGILTLLLCCICPGCPMNVTNRKRILRVNNIEDDVHLVQRKQGIGKKSKSVQVAEWMGRHDAWSPGNRSTDSRTKPTHWEYRGRRDIAKGRTGGGGGGGAAGSSALAAATAAAAAATTGTAPAGHRHRRRRDSSNDEGRDNNNYSNNEDDSTGNRRQTVTIREDAKGGGGGKATKEHAHLHRSRTNLLNAAGDRDIYVEDVDDPHDPEYQSLKRIHHHHHHHQQQHGGGGDRRKVTATDDDGGGPLAVPPIDDDSMRRHELDRGSDLNYERRSSFKRQHHALTQVLIGGEGAEPRDQYYIKEGNAEILRLTTRGGRNDGGGGGVGEENIYVNVAQRGPPVPPAQSQQYIMVDNGGKEILMRRYIEEQANGKQIIREHYQLLPGATFIQTIPNEVPTPVDPRRPQPADHVTEVKISDDDAGGGGVGTDGELKPAVSTHSLIHQELEHSLKQQNALLRQILLEKEKLQERYSQWEQALETQSLPCQSLAVVAATQTDCNTGTQTEPVDAGGDAGGRRRVWRRRRTKSENDDSLSEDEYEYVWYSPPDSPDGVYLIKRRHHRKRSRWDGGGGTDGGGGSGGDQGGRKGNGRRVVVVESVKRKIRTPIREEDDDGDYDEDEVGYSRGHHHHPGRQEGGRAGGYRPRQQHRVRQRLAPTHQETRTSILRRKRNEETLHGKATPKQEQQAGGCGGGGGAARLKRDVLLEISDSLHDAAAPPAPPSDGRRKKVYRKNVKYYEDSDGSEREVEVVQKNYFSADSFDELRDSAELDNYRYTATKTSRSVSTLSPKVGATETTTTTTRIRLNAADSPPKDTAPAAAGKGAVKPAAPPAPMSKALSKEGLNHDPPDSAVNPKYMDWYYNLPGGGGKDGDGSLEKRTQQRRAQGGEGEPGRATVTTTTSSTTTITTLGGGQRKKQPPAATAEGAQGAKGTKPEPAPRSSPPKDEARLLKEDIQHARQLAQAQAPADADSHPLLQHSEHWYEATYDPPPVPSLPADKLPHYLYAETPPIISRDNKVQIKIIDPSTSKPGPAAAAAATVATTPAVTAPAVTVAPPAPPAPSSKPAAAGTTTTGTSKALNVSTLEDDHDSGIAMNSLLHTSHRAAAPRAPRNKIADKKSIFTIAYDDVRIRQIRSESDTPPFS
ncbi:cadherin-86C [Anopheles cruzii]|uniref:cadherin-86C n=1 Tax=Anopheles cruzii TaxID=68878 RepID=UPI0022EC9801|nr:cadherin-86C [Anopheles cruzii]